MKYFLYGYFGFNNFGDDLLLKILIENIEKRDKEAFFYIRNYKEISFLKSKDNIFFTNIEQIIISKGNKVIKFLKYFKEGFKYIKQSDILVIGPGGLFLDKGKFNFSLFFLYLFVKYAYLLNKKVVIIGISIDLIANYVNLYLIKQIFSHSDFISVRDFISYSYVKYLKNFNISNISKSVDLAFLLESKSIDKKIYDNTLGLCFVDYYGEYEKDEKKREEFCNKVYNEIRSIENYKLFYIIFQSGNGLKDDFIYNFLIKKGIKLKKKFIDITNYNELNQIDNFITMRYHLGILGIIFNKKVLIIDHEIKMTSLKLDFDIDYISIDDFFTKDDVFYNFLNNNYKRISYDLSIIKKIAKENFKWLK